MPHCGHDDHPWQHRCSTPGSISIRVSTSVSAGVNGVLKSTLPISQNQWSARCYYRSNTATSHILAKQFSAQPKEKDYHFSAKDNQQRHTSNSEGHDRAVISGQVKELDAQGILFVLGAARHWGYKNCVRKRPGKRPGKTPDLPARTDDKNDNKRDKKVHKRIILVIVRYAFKLM